MAEKLVATLDVAFDSDDDGVGDNAGKNRIILKQVTKRLGVLGELVCWCFPPNGVLFRASVGSVQPQGQWSKQEWEGVKFSDSSSAQLKYPGATNVSINTSTMVLMKKVKNAQGDTRIVPATDARVVWDSDSEEVRVENNLGNPIKVYGGCFVSYTSQFRTLYYFPNTEDTPVGGGDYAFNWSVGTLFGYNNYTVATLDLELDISSPPDWIEYARVTSKIVLDAVGVWEYPPNWDSTYAANRQKLPDARSTFLQGQFPGYTYTIDPDQSFTDERVHCIVKVNSIGSYQFEDFNNGGDGYWAWADPYFGRSDYDPKYECNFVEPPGGNKANSAEDFQRSQNNRTWRTVFLDVDKDAIKARLMKEYPNIAFREVTR